MSSVHPVINIELTTVDSSLIIHCSYILMKRKIIILIHDIYHIVMVLCLRVRYFGVICYQCDSFGNVLARNLVTMQMTFSSCYSCKGQVYFPCP